jgi:hypothetical protein
LEAVVSYESVKEFNFSSFIFTETKNANSNYFKTTNLLPGVLGVFHITCLANIIQELADVLQYGVHIVKMCSM